MNQTTVIAINFLEKNTGVLAVYQLTISKEHFSPQNYRFIVVIEISVTTAAAQCLTLTIFHFWFCIHL